MTLRRAKEALKSRLARRQKMVLGIAGEERQTNIPFLSLGRNGALLMVRN